MILICINNPFGYLSAAVVYEDNARDLIHLERHSLKLRTIKKMFASEMVDMLSYCTLLSPKAPKIDFFISFSFQLSHIYEMEALNSLL